MQVGDVGVSVSLREMRMLVGVSAPGRSAFGVRVRVVTIVVTVPVAVADGSVTVPVGVRFPREQGQRERHQRRRARAARGSTGSPSSPHARATPQSDAVAKASCERAAPSRCAAATSSTSERP